MENTASCSTGSSADTAIQSGPDGEGGMGVVATNGAEGCQQGVSAGASSGNGTVVAKRKQVKAKVTKREKRNEKGEVVSTCWDVQVGSALVRVYFTPNGERELYTVSYWVDRQRKRQVLASLEKAIAEAKKTAEELDKGDKGSADLSAVQRVACRRALELLGPTGIPIELAAALVARFHGRIGDRATMDQVLDCYDRYHPVGMELKRVADVVKECLESKEEDDLSDRYVKQLRYDLDRFKGRFRNYIGNVTGRDIDEWLRSLKVSGRTRNNIRMSVQTLFGFAKGKRYLAKDHDELDAVPVAKEASGAIEIFTPAEMRELLEAASPELVPFLAIGGFAGVRHAEIQRLDWKDVRFDAGIIEIHAGNAKTATRRTVPILPNLRAWLEKDLAEGQERTGPVCPFANVTDQIVSLLTKVNRTRKELAAKGAEGAEGRGAEVGGRRSEVRGQRTEDGRQRTEEGEQRAQELRWKHNGLRHSFISYRVAVTQNVAQVALEAGNSPQVIFSNYRELVTPQDAQAWFGILPASAEKQTGSRRTGQGRKEKARQGRRGKIVAFPGTAVA